MLSLRLGTDRDASNLTSRVPRIQQFWLRFAIPVSSNRLDERNDAVNLNCGERLFEGGGPANINYEINILFPSFKFLC